MKSIKTLTKIQSLVSFIGMCVCTVIFPTRIIPCAAFQNDLDAYNDKIFNAMFPTRKFFDLNHVDANADYDHSMMRINETFKQFGEVYQRIKINATSKEVVRELQDLLILLKNFREYTEILDNDNQTNLNLTNSEPNFSGDTDFCIFNDNVMEFFSHTLGRLNCTISIELDNDKHQNSTKNAEICTKHDFDANFSDRY